MSDPHDLYPRATKAITDLRSQLAPASSESFRTFSRTVFSDGAISTKTKQLIAVAVAHVTQCPFCIRGPTRAALYRGATSQEIMEAIWVAAEMRAGGAYAHATIALDEIGRYQSEKESSK